MDRATQYDPAEAIGLVKKTATAKFDETVEVHIRTGCDGRHAEQQIRGAVVLPNGTGKTVKVLVFAKGAKLDEAQAAGADFVGGDELIPKIQNEGWLDFDLTCFDIVDRFGYIHGNCASLRVRHQTFRSKDFTQTTYNAHHVRSCKSNIIHVPVGKASFSEEALAENYKALMDAIMKAKPSALKSQYLKSITLATTMGPGMKVSTAKYC